MKILVCTDFSLAAAAGERAAAKRFPDATLVLFYAVDLRFLKHVVDRTGLDETHLYDDMLSYADQRLSEMAQKLLSEGRRALVELHSGDPVDLALATAHRHKVDMIIFGGSSSPAIGRFRTLLVRRSRHAVLFIPDENGADRRSGRLRTDDNHDGRRSRTYAHESNHNEARRGVSTAREHGA